MTPANEHLVNLGTATSDDLQSAYLALTIAATKAGYDVQPKSKGTMREAQFRKGGNQPFAMIVNKQSLLFYIRQPALRADESLSAEADRRFGDKVLATTNSLDEVRIKILGQRDAEQLADWLFIA